jgi:hypothetical protein
MTICADRARGIGGDFHNHICGREPDHEGMHVCVCCTRAWIKAREVADA